MSFRPTSYFLFPLHKMHLGFMVIVIYSDKQDPMIFECFMEYQVLVEFVRILKISRNSRIEAPLLQYVSIMIQNMTSEYAIYYCFSNDYMNNIIAHPYEFDRGDLAQYYVSFLRFGFSLSISFLAFVGYKLNISLEITCLVFCF
ncbi:hypothetical protein UlMin_014802 [Ulmus minor]